MVAFATQVKRRRGTQEQNDAFTGAEGEIVVDLTNMTLRVHDGRTRGGFVVGGGAGRNIGDIFFTARTDTSLNGAVEANGGQYNTTDFVGAESIGNILSAGKVPYMTIADFDTAVANNGECTSFGWDGGTVFKVPKINGRRLIRRQLPTADNNYTWYNLYSDGWIEQGGIQQNVGSTAGYRDITLLIEMSGANYTINTTCYSSYTSAASSSHAYVMEKGAVAYNQTSTGFQFFAQDQSSGSYIHWQVSGYAAESEYNDKSTWQYDRYMRPMVQLANGATDEAVVVSGNVLADIAGIKDGDGFTQPGKNTIVGWGMPDYSAGVSFTPAVGTTFTAPSDGLALVYLSVTGGNGNLVFNGTTIGLFGGSNANHNNFSLPVNKGDTITVTMNAGAISSSIGNFYPFKGVN